MASNIKTRSSLPVWPPPMLACWLPTPLLTISRFSPFLLIKKPPKSNVSKAATAPASHFQAATAPANHFQAATAPANHFQV